MSEIQHERQKFSEVEVFSEAAKNWNLDFRQLDRGRLDAEHGFLGTTETQIMRVRLGRRFHQYGVAPTSGRTIAVIDPRSSLPDWCGRRITHDTMPIFAADGSFESVSHPDFDVCTVSVSDDCMNTIAETHDLQRGLERFGEHGVAVNCNSAVLDRLRSRISHALGLAMGTDSLPVSDLVRSILEEEVPSLILQVAQEGIETADKSVGPRFRARTLRVALEYIEANSGSYISLPDLCDATGASARTLRYAFEDRFSLSPVRYLLAHRLNAARKQLLSPHHEAASVQEIAYENGFRHMGLFSTNYRKMFGERPSETLSKYSN